MELNLQRQKITTHEAVYDGYVEQPIECDALLPDYCPDIVGILKCTVSTHIGSSTVNGDRLTIEGMATAHVYYTGEKGLLRGVQYKIPFGKNVELRGPVRDPVVSVTPAVDYVNCRAVNQRRIDIRGALRLRVKVSDVSGQEVVCDAEGGGLQLRKDMVPATEVICQSRFPFSVSEDLEVGYGKGQVGTIVRSDCRVNLQDYKVISGKVVVKGEFALHILYQPLDGEGLEVMEYSLPISQIVDAEGADENSICDVQLVAASCDVQPKAAEDGEYRMVSLDAKLIAQVTAHRHTEIPVASDCYSTQYESSCKHCDVSFIRLVDIVNESVMHKASLELPEELDTVIDAWCEVDAVNWKQSEDSLDLSIRMTVSMFARMLDGQCLYFEQNSDIEHSLALQAACEVSLEPSADIVSLSYNLVGKEKIDIRCELMVRGCIYCTVRQRAIGEIVLDENSEKKKEKSKLYIYYADKGESIWDIAKYYNTSANLIWEENNVSSDTLGEKQMLLIPIV